jgi:hypothetical protein
MSGSAEPRARLTVVVAMFGGAFPTSSRGRWAALGRQQGAVAEKAVPFSRAARRPDFVWSCFQAIVRVLPGAPAACVIVRKRRPTSGSRSTLGNRVALASSHPVTSSAQAKRLKIFSPIAFAAWTPNRGGAGARRPDPIRRFRRDVARLRSLLPAATNAAVISAGARILSSTGCTRSKCVDLPPLQRFVDLQYLSAGVVLVCRELSVGPGTSVAVQKSAPFPRQVRNADF